MKTLEIVFLTMLKNEEIHITSEILFEKSFGNIKRLDISAFYTNIGFKI